MPPLEQDGLVMTEVLSDLTALGQEYAVIIAHGREKSKGKCQNDGNTRMTA